MRPFKIILAMFYDFILLCAIWFVSAIPFVIWQGSDFQHKPLVLLSFQLYLLLITYSYLSYFWLKTGQTPGLRTWKLRLLRTDNYLLTRRNANLRFIMACLFFSIGWITLFVPRYRQTLQDLASETKIIDDNKI